MQLCVYADDVYMQTHKQTVTFKALYPPNIWEQYIDDVFFIL